MKYILSFIIILIYSIIQHIIIHFDNKRLIKNNIDLFIKRHESLVIHEVNNELFKEDKEVLNEK